MYKVLLVDDEAIIRKGLKNIINWQKYGCIVCAEASDGYEGLEMVEEHKPDILFVDIRMPAMDGLEMIGQIGEDEYIPKVIILTGYSDFAYAKEAIALEVYGFLLKPTKLNEIEQTIEKVVEEIDRERKKASEINELYSRYNEYIPKLQERLLYEVLMGITKDPEDIESQALEIGLDAGEYYLSIVSLENDADEVTIEMIGALKTFVDLACEKYTARKIIIDESQYAILISADSLDENEMYSRLKDIKESVYGMLGIGLVLAISSLNKGLLQLNASYSECKIKMGSKDNDTISFGDTGIDEYCKENKLIPFGSVRKSILDIISYGAEHATEKTLNEVLGIMCDEENMVEQMTALAEEIKAMIPMCEYNVDSSSILNVKEDLRYLAKEASKHIAQQTKEESKLIVQKTKEYLKQNYYKHVTLAEVSRAVYVSTYYISRIFSKETGMTITEYINQVRIERACTLLKDVKLKVYQIGDMVGIADAHYFSRMFKKHMGMSPSEYRNIQI